MRRILIVEDEKNIAEIERDYLELDGFEVVIENNGAAGKERAIKEDFDLVILDIMLPDTDGFEICRALRKEKDVPILMVTAKVASIDKVRGLGIGADDYIVKPFDPAELVARVKAHISRYERIKGNVQEKGVDIEYRDLVIKPLSRRVFYKKEEVFLTAKEFDLLYFLASNPNVVFRKETIFDKVWGVDSFGAAGTVVVHLTHNRDKIPMDYIETVRGVGYRFSMQAE